MPSNIAMVEICYSCKEKFCCLSSCPYDKLPALLSCQHLICYGCIQRIWVNLDIDDNNKLLCPVCNILTFLSPSTHHISFYFNKFCSNCAIKNGQIRNKLREKRTEQTLTTIRPETNIALGGSSTPREKNSCDSGSNLRIVQAGIGDINISGRSSQNVESNSANQKVNSKDKQIVTKSRNRSNSKKLLKKRKKPQKKNTQQKTSHSGHSQMKNEKNSQKTIQNSTPDTTGKKLVSPHQTRTNLNTSTDGKIEKNLNQEIKNSANKEILLSISEKSSVGPHYEQNSEYGRAYSRLSSSSNSSGETDIKTNNTPNTELNKLDSGKVKSSTLKGRRVKNNTVSNRESNIVKTTKCMQKKESRNVLSPREGLQIPASLNIDDLVETRTSTSTQSLPNMSLLSCSKYDVEGKCKSNATNVTSSNLGHRSGGIRRNDGSLSDDASNVNQRKIRSSGRNRKSGNKMRWKMNPMEDDSDTECIPPLRKRGFLYRRECFKILDCIYNNEKSELFRHEIKSKYVSDYYKVVKRGMCLDIIAYKIRNNIYTKVKEFSSDMYRIFDNCRLYNQYGSQAYEAANIVQNLFNQKMIECFSN